jgi:hypothetical protein
MADLPPYPGTPRWVKVFGAIVVFVLILFALLMHLRGPGGHGPRRHGAARHRTPAVTPAPTPTAPVPRESPTLPAAGQGHAAPPSHQP